MVLITGTSGNDSARFGGRDLVGTAADDDIFGLAGNDTLDGGTGGIDLLDGGAGDDTLSATGVGSVLNGGAGNDTLFVAGFSGAGSILNGGDGNDRLDAEDADDMLFGGAGNDRLNDGFGQDLLIGEEGDDTYVLTPEAGVNVDTIIETAEGGIDTVQSEVDFRLPDNVENLLLNNGVFGTGNELNNTITASNLSTNNTLSGLRGNDSLSGGGGRDTLIGGAGNDSLTGGIGNDRLIGGAGADRFRFLAINEGVDLIADFETGKDSIRVSASFGGGLTGRAAISADQFHIGTGAIDASDRFIYNRRGDLFFDVDGNGRAAQVQIAALPGTPTLSAADIIVL